MYLMRDIHFCEFTEHLGLDMTRTTTIGEGVTQTIAHQKKELECLPILVLLCNSES